MSRRGSSSFGWGTIIFWIILGYFMFGGNDEDKKDLEVLDQDTTEDSQQVSDDLNKVGDDLKQAIGHAKDSLDRMRDEVIQNIEVQKEDKQPKQEEEAEVAEPEVDSENSKTETGPEEL